MKSNRNLSLFSSYQISTPNLYWLETMCENLGREIRLCSSLFWPKSQLVWLFIPFGLGSLSVFEYCSAKVLIQFQTLTCHSTLNKYQRECVQLPIILQSHSQTDLSWVFLLSLCCYPNALQCLTKLTPYMNLWTGNMHSGTSLNLRMCRFIPA